MLESLSFKNYNYFPIQTKEKGRRAECLRMGRENYVPSGSGLSDELSLQRQHRKELNIFIFLNTLLWRNAAHCAAANLKYVGAQRRRSLFHSKQFTFAFSEGHLLRLYQVAFLNFPCSHLTKLWFLFASRCSLFRHIHNPEPTDGARIKTTTPGPLQGRVLDMEICHGLFCWCFSSKKIPWATHSYNNLTIHAVRLLGCSDPVGVSSFLCTMKTMLSRWLWLFSVCFLLCAERARGRTILQQQGLGVNGGRRLSRWRAENKCTKRARRKASCFVCCWRKTNSLMI